jgi:outer membrane lipoprotein-sorting protein
MPMPISRLPKKLLALLAVACLFGLAVGASAQQAPAPPDDAALTPETILLSMARVYRTCRSYRDSGEVRGVLRVEDGRAGSRRPFATAFVRPDRFRFEFTDSGLGERTSSYVVWIEPEGVRAWWDAQPGIRGVESLKEALGTASGISGGSSTRVPALLLPRQVGEGPPLATADRLDDATDRDVPCFRIKGRPRAVPYTVTTGGRVLTVQDESVTLWIARGTFLLRKVEEWKDYGSYTQETVTTYEPEIDVDLPADELTFVPPQTPPPLSP